MARVRRAAPTRRSASARPGPTARRVPFYLPGHGRFALQVEAGVHAPDPYAGTFAAALRIRPGDQVLDLGCGAGAYGLAAAALGAGSVLLTDTEPAAVRCAVENLAHHGFLEVEGRVGSLFQPVRGERFDAILTSLPQLPAPRPVIASRYGGRDGLTVLRRLAAQAPRHLRPGGRLYALVTDWAYPARVTALLRAQGFRVRVVARVERAFQPAEYDALAPGLFAYLDARARRGLAAYRRQGSWCHLGVSFLEARLGRGDGVGLEA